FLVYEGLHLYGLPSVGYVQALCDLEQRRQWNLLKAKLANGWTVASRRFTTVCSFRVSGPSPKSALAPKLLGATRLLFLFRRRSWCRQSIVGLVSHSCLRDLAHMRDF